MSVTYAIEFDVREGKRELFLKLLGDVLSTMKREDSYRGAALHVSPDNPLRFMLVETWADHQEVLDVQLHRPYRREWHAALPELLESPRRISMWTPVPES
ncbi:antibiotic biosynthesis monooxygenase [Pyxidicoccus parkwayensis]|uniref:Antibiotic biosynthesis monooxygenase n=1 Tax=Pyxidicoccus parkwayensis TaxID=2813578 RepID=A0ABX7P540_9BACT|nr:putative quinol monooxygenase [Pyxidicoccus parkwaysis]QSQ25588.1 antibiotic biosynthesis monooxygenase [Pyxidicoccus parkwaysis]